MASFPYKYYAREREQRLELVDIQPSLQRALNVCEPVRQHEREFLYDRPCRPSQFTAGRTERHQGKSVAFWQAVKALNHDLLSKCCFRREIDTRTVWFGT